MPNFFETSGTRRSSQRQQDTDIANIQKSMAAKHMEEREANSSNTEKQLQGVDKRI